MSKYHVPINLTRFTVESNNATTVQVVHEIKALMKWLKTNQDHYYQNGFTDLTERLLNEELILKGSLNSFGRSIGLTPPIPATYQLHNTAEMFRVSILAKTSAYLQNEIILTIIQDQDEPTPKSVLAEYKKYYPNHKTPTQQFIKNSIKRITENGVTHGTPKGDGVLNYWATDMHYSKVTQNGSTIYFTLKLENLGVTTLKFLFPNKERFTGGKVTRPNVFLDKKGNLKFGFTLQKELPKDMPQRDNILGVDLGLVEPFTGTVLFGDDTHSSPFLPNHQVNIYHRKISRLRDLSSKVWLKEELNKVRGHAGKADILRTERLRLRSKISRLKVEQSHALANQIVTIAESHQAIIYVENLAWIPNSSWDQSRQQDMIEHKAKIKNIKVRKVNPKDTSNKCHRCGSLVKHSGRASHCVKCVRSLNRDILASRNISQSNKPRKITQKSLQTRVTKPATTGAVNNYVLNFQHSVQEIQHN